MSARRVLVTGASGFIGTRTLPKLLARGFEVHAVSRLPQATSEVVTWHRVDLSDDDAVAATVARVRPEVLLHLAWETAHGTYYSTPLNLRHLREGLHLMERFVANGGSRFVGAGSAAEYDYASGRDLSEEVTALRPNGLYGVSKKALCDVTAQLAVQSGVEHVWGRIFFCYGPGESPARAVPRMLRDLDAGVRVPFQPGDGVRDYLFVDDVAEAFVTLLDSSVQGPVNVASGIPITLRDFMTRLADLSGHLGAIDFGAVPQPAYEPARIVGEVSRLRAAGWLPRHSLDEGLRETITWWRGGGAGGPARRGPAGGC